MISLEVKQMDEKLKALHRVIEETLPSLSPERRDNILSALHELAEAFRSLIQTIHPEFADSGATSNSPLQTTPARQPASGMGRRPTVVKKARRPMRNCREMSTGDVPEPSISDNTDQSSSNYDSEQDYGTGGPDSPERTESAGLQNISDAPHEDAQDSSSSNDQGQNTLGIADHNAGNHEGRLERQGSRPTAPDGHNPFDQPEENDISRALSNFHRSLETAGYVSPLPDNGPSLWEIFPNDEGMMSNAEAMKLAFDVFGDDFPFGSGALAPEQSSQRAHFDSMAATPVPTARTPTAHEAQNNGPGPYAQQADLQPNQAFENTDGDMMIWDRAEVFSFAQAMQNAGLALMRGEEVSLGWILPTERFRCAWGEFDGQHLRAMLDDLIYPGEVISELVMEYFVQKLVHSGESSGLWIGKLHELGRLSHTQRRRPLIIIKEYDRWSLVEVQPSAGKIIHYEYDPGEPLMLSTFDHNQCRNCDRIESCITHLLHEQHSLTMPWERSPAKVRTWAPNVNWLVWTIRLRAAGGDVSQPVPREFRADLVQEMLADFKAAQATEQVLDMPRQFLPVQNKVQILEGYYMGIGAKNQCGDKIWRTVSDLADIPSHRGNNPIGLQRASELVELAIKIGSPEALLTIKASLRELRLQSQHLDAPYDTAYGAFRALQAFSKKSELSKLGLRLAQYKLAQIRNHRGDIEAEILGTVPEGTKAPTRTEIRHDLEQLNKGNYWDIIVDEVGNKDPNILCLISRGSFGPPVWKHKFSPTTYRDLSHPEKKIVGRIFRDLKPNTLMGVDPGLSSNLLYMRPPTCRYPLEDTGEEIIQETGHLLFFNLNMLTLNHPRRGT